MVDVSVIVPVYGVEAYLEPCLASLAAQTLAAMEVIVVIDASPDDSETIVDRYCADYPQRFRKRVLKHNVGVSEARNRGMALARGRYLGFVDGDDLVAASMYQQMFDAAQDTGCDMVSCEVARFEDDQGPQGAVKMRLDHCYLDTFVTNKLFRRSAVEALKLRFYRDLIFEDEPFIYTVRLSGCHEVRIDSPLYLYRLTGHSQCRNPERQRRNIQDKCLMLIRMMADLQQRGLLEPHRDRVLQCLAHHALSAFYYPLALADLIGFLRTIAFLIGKYRLLTDAGAQSEDYFIRVYLSYCRTLPLIVLLKTWLTVKQRLGRAVQIAKEA